MHGIREKRMTCNRACIYTIYPKRKKIRFMLNEEGNNEENLFGIKLFFLKGVCWGKVCFITSFSSFLRNVSKHKRSLRFERRCTGIRIVSVRIRKALMRAATACPVSTCACAITAAHISSVSTESLPVLEISLYHLTSRRLSGCLVKSFGKLCGRDGRVCLGAQAAFLTFPGTLLAGLN